MATFESDKIAHDAVTSISDSQHNDEKNIETSESTIGKDWTVDEEKKVLRKIDLLVMPLLTLSFFALQLDRGNIGNALTDFFLKDVGITQTTFNAGQQLLQTGIIVLEIPSNIILYKIGPTVWIGFQILAWGMVAVFQAFQKGKGAFYATRFILGLCESGFIPGSLYTITRWYKKDETSKRFSIFFLGNAIASAISGLLAYGILHMRGVRHLAGWQWIFIIEGLFTIAIGFIFFSLFPRSTASPKSMFGVMYFNERERHIVRRRILLDDPSKEQTHHRVKWSEFKALITNWTLLPHIVLTIAGLAPFTSIGTYGPTLVNSFGYERLQANAFSSIGNWVSIFVILFWGFAADKLRARGPMVWLGVLINTCIIIANRALITSKNGHGRFAALCFLTTFGTEFHAVNGSWMALNAPTAAQRSMTLAVTIMSANIAGLIGAQMFQEHDKPLYHRGWAAILSLVVIALGAATVANLQYWYLNGRKFGRSLKYKA